MGRHDECRIALPLALQLALEFALEFALKLDLGGAGKLVQLASVIVGRQSGSVACCDVAREAAAAWAVHRVRGRTALLTMRVFLDAVTIRTLCTLCHRRTVLCHVCVCVCVRAESECARGHARLSRVSHAVSRVVTEWRLRLAGRASRGPVAWRCSVMWTGMCIGRHAVQ